MAALALLLLLLATQGGDKADSQVTGTVLPQTAAPVVEASDTADTVPGQIPAVTPPTPPTSLPPAIPPPPEPPTPISVSPLVNSAGTNLPADEPVPPSTPAPREVTAEFTVRLEETGPVLQGAQVVLVYTATPGEPPLTLGRGATDAEGVCKITAALTVSQQKSGSFDAVVSHDGMREDWVLPDFPQDLRYHLWIAGRTSGLSEEHGKSITNSIGMKLVLVPAGEFVMGSREDLNAHRVRITEPFLLGATEVTQGQYEQVMGTNPSDFTGDPQRPVEQVSWRDAVEFCRKLSQMEHKKYRLPTEAQWEYACRAGSSTKWCFGDDESSLIDYAWCGKNSDRQTHPVGQKRPNAWGLYDMHGNVWEYCADVFDRNAYGRFERRSITRDAVAFCVVRGRSWFDVNPDLFRCARREHSATDYRSHNRGFRVARTLTP